MSTETLAPITARAFAETLVAEFAASLAPTLGNVTTPPARTPAAGDGWCLSGALTGPRPGIVAVWVDVGGAERLVRRLMGADSPDESAITGLLRDLWTQAATAVAGRPEYTALKLSLETTEASIVPDGAAMFDLQAGEITARLAVTARFTDEADVSDDKPSSNLDVVLDIDLPLVVRFARTTMSIRALSTIGPGSIVDMERSPDEPVQVLVGDHVIARGEVVVVGGNYGVRITGVVSPGDRMRGLEA